MATPAISKSISSIVLPDCFSVAYISAENFADFSVMGKILFSEMNSSKMFNCLKAFLARSPLVISSVHNLLSMVRWNIHMIILVWD